MNKKAYIILLAVAAHQSSMMADWKTWRQKSAQSTQSTAQTDNATPTFIVNEALSGSEEYRVDIEGKLRHIFAAAKRNGAIDITELESAVITEYTPKIIQPGTDALKEEEEKSEQKIAAIRAKNDDLAQQVTRTKHTAMLTAIAMLAVGFAAGHYTK